MKSEVIAQLNELNASFPKERPYSTFSYAIRLCLSFCKVAGNQADSSELAALVKDTLYVSQGHMMDVALEHSAKAEKAGKGVLGKLFGAAKRKREEAEYREFADYAAKVQDIMKML